MISLRSHLVPDGNVKCAANAVRMSIPKHGLIRYYVISFMLQKMESACFWISRMGIDVKNIKPDPTFAEVIRS